MGRSNWGQEQEWKVLVLPLPIGSVGTHQMGAAAVSLEAVELSDIVLYCTIEVLHKGGVVQSVLLHNGKEGRRGKVGEDKVNRSTDNRGSELGWKLRGDKQHGWEKQEMGELGSGEGPL